MKRKVLPASTDRLDRTRDVRRSGSTAPPAFAIPTLVLSLPATYAAEWVVEGRVVGVSDGDTITVLDDAKTQHKIRFAGIDAPEKG